MKHGSGYHRNDWHDDLHRPKWGQDRHQGHGGDHHNEVPPSAAVASAALQTGLWAAGCLLIATSAPAVLMVPLLSELLLMAAFAVSMLGLLRGERLSLSQFNRQDVALALVALSLIAAFFIDHSAVQAYVQAHAAAHGAAAHAAASAGAAAGGAG